MGEKQHAEALQHREAEIRRQQIEAEEEGVQPRGLLRTKRKLEDSYSTLNPNSVMPAIKQLYTHTWYDSLPSKGQSIVKQIGEKPVILESGVDVNTKIKPIVWKDSEFGNIKLSNNYVDTSFSNVRYPYNNHGI